MALIDIERIGSFVADSMLKENYSEKGRQDALSAKLSREKLRAPSKNTSEKQEQEEEIEQEIEAIEMEIWRQKIAEKKEDIKEIQNQEKAFGEAEMELYGFVSSYTEENKKDGAQERKEKQTKEQQEIEGELEAYVQDQRKNEKDRKQKKKNNKAQIVKKTRKRATKYRTRRPRNSRK